MANEKFKGLNKLFTKEGARKRFELEQKKEYRPDEEQIRKERSEYYERKNPNYKPKKSSLEQSIEKANRESRARQKSKNSKAFEKIKNLFN